MRVELLYNPRVLCERLAIESLRRRRLRKLKGTVAGGLSYGHIDSLELLELLNPMKPEVFYDIGANVGTWSMLVKACFPLATIHAFEPLKLHCELFEKSVQAISDVTLHKIALGPKTGTSKLQVTSFSDASSLLELAQASVIHFGISTQRQETVNVRALDTYVLYQNIPAPDVIKLDVQGYELEVLRGGERCLDKAKAVICEVSFVEFYRGQALFHDVVEYVHRHGFHLHALAVNTPVGEQLVQTDALFLRD